MKKLLKQLFVCLIISIGATNIATSQAQLLFQSGFEGTSTVVEDGGNDIGVPYERLTGIDNTLTTKNSWTTDWTGVTSNAKMQVQYTGGDAAKRFAKVVTDPTNANNKVLQFWLNDSWVADGGALKSRVQTNLYGIVGGFKEFYQSVRVFLPTDFNELRTYPSKITWCTLSEFWNNEWWVTNEPYGFRVSLGIGKPTAATSDLNFILNAENAGQIEVWNGDNTNIKVPIGKWFKMDYYYKEGNAQTGRFWMSITPDGEPTKVVFDIRNFTHNTYDPAPNGVTGYNPLKLYTAKEHVSYVKARGKTLQVYWDDYKLWKNKTPETTPTQDITDNSDIQVQPVQGGVDITTIKEEKYRIINLMGQVVASGNCQSGTQFVPFKGNGIYIVKVSNKPFKVFLDY